jgi:hypothetical protein
MAKWRTNGWTAFGSEFNPPAPVAIQDLWEAIDALARKTNGTQIHPIAKGSHPNNVEWIGLLRRWQRKPKVGCEIRLLTLDRTRPPLLAGLRFAAWVLFFI